MHTTCYVLADYVLTMATTACHICLRFTFCALATASAVKQKSIVQQHDVSGYALDNAFPLQYKHQDCYVRSCVAHGQYSVLQIRATIVYLTYKSLFNISYILTYNQTIMQHAHAVYTHNLHMH